MDRQRPKEYMQQLPRADKGQVEAAARIADKQAVLHQTWPQYCAESQYDDELYERDNQKWVIETWDEYESRIIQRDSTIKRFFEKQSAKEAAASERARVRNAAGDSVLELIKHRERKRKARLLPTLHTLLYDPEREAALQRQAEQEELLKKEEIERKIVAEEARKTLEGVRRVELDARTHIQAMLRRRVEEEEERQRQLEEDRRIAREAEEARVRRIQKEEQDRQEQERLIKAEDQARKRMQQDEIIEWKDVEERTEQDRDRILREEEAAAARREIELKRRQKEERTRDGPEDADASRGRELLEQRKSLFLQQETAGLPAFLARLKARMADVTEEAQLHEVMRTAVEEIPPLLSGYAVYLGLREGNELHYRFASSTCSPALRQGDCVLRLAEHPSCPTALAVDSRRYELVNNVRRGGFAEPGHHRRVVGQQLTAALKTVSFDLLGPDAESHRLVPNVSADPRVVPYGGSGPKREDWLLLVPLAVPFGQPLALLGIEGPASAPLPSDALDLVHQAAGELGRQAAAARKRAQKAAVARQLVQWLEATTPLANFYVGVREEGGALRYVAASKGQEFLVGQELPPTEGVSHQFLASPDPTLRVPDVSANAAVKLFDPAKRGKKAELALFALANPAGRYGVLGCDTLAGPAAITDADFAAIAKAAQLAADVFAEVDRGAGSDPAADGGAVLAIEKLVGPTGVRFLKRVFTGVVKQLEALTKDQLLEMAHYKAPPAVITRVVSATLVLLGNKPSTVAEWAECRPFVKPDLVAAMAAFDPTKAAKKAKGFFIHSNRTLKGLTAEEVFQKGSLPASLCFQWSYASLQLRRAANALRKLHETGADETLVALDQGQETEEEADGANEAEED